MDTSKFGSLERKHLMVYKNFITFAKLSGLATVVVLALLAITLL